MNETTNVQTSASGLMLGCPPYEFDDGGTRWHLPYHDADGDLLIVENQ